jgi:hypothetical protein
MMADLMYLVQRKMTRLLLPEAYVKEAEGGKNRSMG